MAAMRIPGRISKQDRQKCESWIQDNLQEGRLHALAGIYCQAPIVLYTGCGVSTCPPVPKKEQRYGLPTWFPLLSQVCRLPETRTWPVDPWVAADEAVELCGGYEAFKDQLRLLIGSPQNYRSKGQLNDTFVGNAFTLRALAAFCGQLTGRITGSKGERVYYRAAPNPRISAVLTANYDCFLEAAGSNLYIYSPLKPVTALGSPAGSLSRIPVFHIHGYVPHLSYRREKSKQKIQTIDELVITRQDYEKYWKPDDVFGTTMGPQIHYLRYYTALFVGFSFTDEYVCRLLRRIYKDYLSSAGRTHFALLEAKRVCECGEVFFRDMGVTPIAYKDHEEIPTLLGQLYRAGLAADRIFAEEEPFTQTVLPELITRKYKPTGRSYHYETEHLWKIMQACRDGSVPASLVYGHEVLQEESPGWSAPSQSGAEGL